MRGISERGYGGKSAIAKIIKTFQTEHTLEVKKRSGRPRLTSRREDRILIRKCLLDRRSSSKQLANELRLSTGCDVSERTIRRRLLAAGLKSCRPTRKP